MELGLAGKVVIVTGGGAGIEIENVHGHKRQGEHHGHFNKGEQPEAQAFGVEAGKELRTSQIAQGENKNGE